MHSQIEGEEFVSGDYENDEIEDEPTVVDPLIPPTLADAGQGVDQLEVEDTSVTSVEGRPEDPPAGDARGGPLPAGELDRSSPEAQGIPAALFPPREATDPGGAVAAPLREVPTDTITTRAERPVKLDQLVPADVLHLAPPEEQDTPWGAPSIDSPQVAFQQDDIPTQALRKSPENHEDLEAIKLTPLPLPGEMPASSSDILNSSSPAPSSFPETPPQETYTSEAVTASSPLTGRLTSPHFSDTETEQPTT